MANRHTKRHTTSHVICCWVTSVVSNSVQPHRRQPPGSPVAGILQARTLEWVAISFSNAWKWKVKVKSLGHVRLLATPWTAAHQTPPSMGFSRQEYWSGVPLPSPIYVIMFPYYPFDSHKVLSDIPCFIPAIFHFLCFFFLCLSCWIFVHFIGLLKELIFCNNLNGNI